MTFDDLGTQAMERFRGLASLLPDYVVIINRERCFRWVNRVAPGLTMEEVLSRRVDDFVAANDLPEAVRCIEHCFETGEPMTYWVGGYGDGTQEYYFESRVVSLDDDADEPRVMIITTNRTEERKAERRFRKLLESSPDYIVAIDTHGKMLYVNRVHPAIEEGDVLGQHILEFVPAESKANAAAVVKGALEDRKSGSWESRSSLPGSERFVIRVLPVDGPDEARALIVIQDVSDQARAARALEASEERLSRILGAGKMGLYEIDVKTGRGAVSPVLAERLGVADDIPMEHWGVRIHADDRVATMAKVGELMAGRRESIELEYRLRMRDGEYRRFQDQMTVASPGRVAGLVTDVTEVRELEEHHRALKRQLEQTQKLESIGQLAGGVAHDFNNLLTVIMNGTHLARRKLENGQDASDELAHVSHAADRGAKLTRQLLAFSCRTTLAIEPIDPASVVVHVVDMTRRLIPETIDVSFLAPDSVCIVRADRNQLEQALLNLCINARDAMPEGGKLVVSVSVDAQDVVIAVADSGHGIAAEDRDRIFEPFFTTKPVGTGTGLGLAMVHGIVQQHGGTISVESKEGEGTKFEIRLPRSHAQAKEEARPIRTQERGEGRILVAEDEPSVLATVTSILEDSGYDVVTARDGQEAVERFEADEAGFDLLLLDAVMPRLTGWLAYERIRQSAPGIPVLFCSGYSATAFPERLTERPPLVAKPYEPNALLRAIAEAMTSKT